MQTVRRIASLIFVIVLVLASLVMLAPAAKAETSTVGYSIQACGAVTWSYTGRPALREEWLASVSRVDSVSPVDLVEAEPGTAADIEVVWGPKKYLIWGETFGYGTNEILTYSEIVLSDRYPKYVKRNWSPARFSTRIEYLMVHELGHALGLDHSEGSFDLMSPDMTFGSARLTANDLLAFGATRPVCDPILG